MPTIVQTYQGRVTGLWGSAMMRGADGKMHALKMGDLVHKGDVILTSQDGIVQLVPDDTAIAAAAKPADTDIDRVISGLNDPDSPDAPAAGLAGGDGAGDLTPGLRVDRISEAVTPASALGSSTSADAREFPPTHSIEGAVVPTSTALPPVTPPPVTPPPVTPPPVTPPPAIGADSEHIHATEEGPAVGLGLNAPTNTSGAAVITVTQLPLIGQLQTADGTPVALGSTLTPAELVGLKYLPPADYDGSAPVGDVVYTVSDGGVTVTGTVGIDLGTVNDAPVASADAGTTPAGTPLSGNVLANDHDADSDVLQVTQYVVGGVAHQAGSSVAIDGVGSLTIDADGSYTFTPAAGYAGAVPVVTYTVSDGSATATSTLTLAVSPSEVTPTSIAPDANDDVATTPINVPVTVAVLANDHGSGADGAALTVSAATLADPSRGSVVVNADGTLTFTPASNVVGPVTIGYTVSDGHGATDTATVTITVGTNTPPDAADATRTIGEDSAYTVTTADLGFTDADAGQTLANVRIDALPGAGSLLLDATPVSAGAVVSAADLAAGKLVFVPAADGHGAPYANFSFSVQDSSGAFDPTPNTLTLNVTPLNDALNTLADVGSSPEDTTLAGNVLGNDTDIDGDALSVTQFSVAGTTYAAGATATLAGIGSLVINADGGYAFTPAANYHGEVPVATYTATDGTATSSATLALTVTPVNDAPLAADDAASTPFNTPVTISVLPNDTDPDGDPLTVASATLADPTRGTVSVNPDGTLSFTPTTGTSGPVTITYTVSDGHGGSDSANVIVDVGTNTPPTGADSTHTIAEGGAYTVAVADFGFADADAGQTLAQVRIDSLPAAGGLLLDGVAVGAGAVIAAADVAAGKLVFVPAADGNGAPYANFGFSVQDSSGAFDTAPNTLTLNVTPVNDPSVLVADSGSANEDTVQTGNVLANDSDVDGDALSVTQFVVGGTTYAAGATATLAGVGTLMIGADGHYSFTPVADYHGAVPVATYSVSDSTVTTTSTLSLSVAAVADIVGDTVAAVEDQPISFNPITGLNETGGADNFENAGRTLTAVGTPSHGTATFAADGTIHYTPAANYNGPDSFTYTVTSGGVSETATINVNVAPANDAPTLSTPAPQFTSEDTAQLISGVSVGDLDGDTLSTTLTVAHGALAVSAGSGAAVSGDGSGSVTLTGTAAQINAALATLGYSPAADYHGSDTLHVSTSDGTTTVNADVALGIAAVADIVDDTVGATESTPITFNPITANNETSGADNFEDAGRALTAVGAPAHGGVSFAADGTITYTPVAGYHGADSFSYTVTSGGVTETATITVNVASVNSVPAPAPDANVGNEDTVQTGNVLANDSDGDGDALAVTQFVVGGSTYAAGATATLAGVGTLMIGADGHYAFTPVADYHGAVPVATYSVSDGTDTTTSTLSLSVTAVADIVADTIATVEDTPISFNPITGLNETSGADNFENAGRSLTAVGTPSHGTVTFAADGTITYTPAANYNGPDSFTYTVSSGGVTETATITVNVASTDDAPVIGAASVRVSEEGLAGANADGTGSTDTTDGTSVSGTIALADIDSAALTVTLGAPATPLTSAGTTVTWASANNGHTLIGSAGSQTLLTVTIDDAGHYTVNLTGPVDQAATGVEDVKSIGIVVNVSDGTLSAAGTLAIGIEDDSPVIGTPANAILVNATGAVAVGDLHLGIGADSGSGAAAVFAGSSVDANGFITANRVDTAGNAAGSGYLTYGGSQLHYVGSSDGSISAVDSHGTAVYTVAGDIASGDYTVTMLHALDPVQVTADAFGAITAGNNGLYTFSDTGSNFDFTAIGTTSGGVVSTVNTNANVFGVGNNFIDTGETLTFSAAAHVSGTAAQLSGAAFVARGLGSGEALTWIAYDAAHHVVGQGTVDGAGNKSTNDVSVTLSDSNFSAPFSSIEFGSTGSGANYKLELTSFSGASESFHQVTNVAVHGVDSDGDSSSTQAVSLTFNATTAVVGTGSEDALGGSAGNDTLSGGSSADILIGGHGNDTLIGGAGADVFKWSLGDQGTTAVKAADTISDFDNGASGDKLDLRDLLVGDHSDLGNLANFMHFSVAGGSTKIEISSSGGFAGGNYSAGAVDQTITLTGVDLKGAFTTDNQIINDLITRSKIVVDH